MLLANPPASLATAAAMLMPSSYSDVLSNRHSINRHLGCNNNAIETNDCIVTAVVPLSKVPLSLKDNINDDHSSLYPKNHCMSQVPPLVSLPVKLRLLLGASCAAGAAAGKCKADACCLALSADAVLTPSF